MIYVITYLFILSLAFPLYHIVNAYRQSRYLALPVPRKLRSFALIVPCYNEGNLVDSIYQNFSTIDYPAHEIIIVNDGSTDDTLPKLLDAFDFEVSGFLIPEGRLAYKDVNAIYRSRRHPNIYLLDKANGGKADSINAGIDHATAEIIITLDADSFLKKDALHRLNQSFEAKGVVAAGGNVQVVQSVKADGTFSFKNMNMLLKLQTMEYLKGFYILKQSLAFNQALSIVSGAFGAFRRETLLDVGGFRITIGEDMDITMKIQKHIAGTTQRIVFDPLAICYTEIPCGYRDFFNQRIRWQKAFVDCLIAYLPAVMRRTFRDRFSFFFFFDSFHVGLLATVSTFLFLVFTVVDPSVDTFWLLAVFFFATSFVSVLYNVVALLVARRMGHRMGKREIATLTLVFLVDMLFYRFFNIFIIVAGSLLYFVNGHSWNKVARSNTFYNFIP